MASAAAVAADASRTPLPDHEFDPVSNTTGTIKGIEDAGDDGNDDDISRSARRGHRAVFRAESDDEDNEIEEDTTAVVNGDGRDRDDGEDKNNDKDLFGSESEDEGDSSRSIRRLDDEELDSGDDEGRNDRTIGDVEMEEDAPEQQELAFMDADIGRHPIPEPSDGELYLLKVPRFFSIDPHAFQAESFQPPSTDHHSKTEASSTFSPFNTAMTTIRWRQSPSNPSQLQSNARVLRWSDGSLTLQLATNPQVQYLMPGNALSPPQINPPKPTPTSIQDSKDGKRKVKHVSYNAERDSFTYLVAPNERSQMLRITNKFTTSLNVQPVSNTADDALERLQNSLAAAVRGPGDGNDTGIGFIQISEDPEMAKKKAEVAEREKIKAQRRRETQEARDRERTGKVLYGAKRGGLTVGGLEDDDLGMDVGGGRRFGASRRPKPKRAKRASRYSDEEEDYGRRGRTREDEYDEEDDFVAASDEEEEIVDDDEDEDDGIREERSVPVAAARNRDRFTSPKRDLDAEGEPDDEMGGTPVAGEAGAAGSPVSRNKRRRVIDDEDDEDE